MSSALPSPIGPATTAKRGTMSAADKTKLDAVAGTNTGDVTVSSPAGWLSRVGQALTFALVSASAGVAGVVDLAAQTLTGAKRGAVVALTSSAGALPIDLAAANNFAHALTENTTLAAPSNPVAGQSGVIVFAQHSGAAKTLGFNSFWKFAGGTVPTLTTTLGAVDTFAYYVESATRATCSLIKDIK